MNAGDVGAFSDFLGYVSNNSKFSDIRESGIYGVAIDNPNSVTDLPVYNGVKIYSYGFLTVFKSDDRRIHQTYYSHQGDIATRQTWGGPGQYLPWTIQYSTKNPPDSNIPVGAPIPWPQLNPPSGYLTCNGQSFNKSTYPKLAVAYPSSRLPDLRGEFIRGWDDRRGVDPGRVCGSWQADLLASHKHGYRDQYYIENMNSLHRANNKEATPAGYNGNVGSDGTDTDNNSFLYIDSTTSTTGGMKPAPATSPLIT
nr:phage tail protein [Photorhabdus luminescens]